MLFPLLMEKKKADRTSILEANVEATLTHRKALTPCPSPWDSFVYGLSSWQREYEGADPSGQQRCSAF